MHNMNEWKLCVKTKDAPIWRTYRHFSPIDFHRGEPSSFTKDRYTGAVTRSFWIYRYCLHSHS